MPLTRDKPTGLPFNCYERRGARLYSIGYKKSPAPGKPRVWQFKLQCPVGDQAQIIQLRRQAIKRIADIQAALPGEGTFKAWANAWLDKEKAKPLDSEGRRAETTLAENGREIAKLNSILGHVEVAKLKRADAYDYLEEAERKRRSAKANKEISLARTILEWCVQKGAIEMNPFDGITKLVTKQYDRHVTDEELALAVEMGRRLGGASHIVAMALKTAYLCVRRSVEVRDFQRHQITDAGIAWVGAKRKRGSVAKVGLIEWSPELTATIQEALAVKRFDSAPATFYVFGNMSGAKYTKGGWKKMLHNLMTACEAEAQARGIPFKKFSLQDCRPKGVTDKLEQGDADTQDATLHSNAKMIESVYDRRRVRVAKPVR
jgi:hypothetical protein